MASLTCLRRLECLGWLDFSLTTCPLPTWGLILLQMILGSFTWWRNIPRGWKSNPKVSWGLSSMLQMLPPMHPVGQSKTQSQTRLHPLMGRAARSHYKGCAYKGRGIWGHFAVYQSSQHRNKILFHMKIRFTSFSWKMGRFGNKLLELSN